MLAGRLIDHELAAKQTGGETYGDCRPAREVPRGHDSFRAFRFRRENVTVTRIDMATGRSPTRAGR